jgi:hypothetical protein
MSQAYDEVIETGKAILKGRWKDSYVKQAPDIGIEQLDCPGCGVTIMKLMPAGAERITRVKTQTFIQTFVALCKLANYREVSFKMTDGSRHVTNMCHECAEASQDPMFATAIYARNLAQFQSEGTPVSDALANRGPVERLHVANAITD